MPDYKLSESQSEFVRQVEAAGYEVDYDYSGRGMCGRACPAVRLDRGDSWGPRGSYASDSMGLGRVIYAP